MTPKVSERIKHSKLFVSNPGNPLKEIKHGEVGEDGNINLVVDRIEDTDALIQSYAPSTMIENIMERISAGQVELLSQREGFYIDALGLPSNYAEMLNLVIRGQNEFEKLPVEIKQKFDNDFNRWFAEMSNESWFEKMGLVSDTKEEIKPVEKESDKE